MEKPRMTNCKYIHMMSCRDLANFIVKVSNGYCEQCPALSYCQNDPKYFYEPENIRCREQIINWLESEDIGYVENVCKFEAIEG